MVVAFSFPSLLLSLKVEEKLLNLHTWNLSILSSSHFLSLPIVVALS